MAEGTEVTVGVSVTGCCEVSIALHPLAISKAKARINPERGLLVKPVLIMGTAFKERSDTTDSGFDGFYPAKQFEHIPRE